MDRASLEQLLDQGLSLSAIGQRFGRHESTVAYWVEKHGLEAAKQGRHAARGGLERMELEQLVNSGASIAQIAEAVDRSKPTVRHWLRRYGLKTHGSVGMRPAQQAVAAKEAGLATVTMRCRQHGETDFWITGRGYYRCKRCRSEAVTRRRRKVKAILVDEAGGKCLLCGYDRCIAALHFHHLDRARKSFHLSYQGAARSLATSRAEARKCVLLCSNCHAEVEAGITTLV